MRRTLLLLAAILSLAGCSSTVPSVQPASGASGSNACGTATANVVYLQPADVADSNGAAARQAAAAYLTHHVIVLCGGELAQLARALHLDDGGTVDTEESVTKAGRVVPITRRGKPGPPFTATPPPLSTPEPQTVVPPAAVGYFLSTAGVVKSFNGFFGDPRSEKYALDVWFNDVMSLHDSPSIGSWHQVFTNTESYKDDRGNIAQITFNYWRLNNFNTKLDWYMETQRVLGTPKWSDCQFDFFFKDNGFIGYFNSNRSVIMRPKDNPGAILYEHAPKTTESTKTASFSIGASLNGGASGPGGSVSAEYSQSWSQPDVTIRDHTHLPTSEQEVAFSSPDLGALVSPHGCPPQTARTTFDTPHASIFQVGQGQSVTIASGTHETFKMWNPVIGEVIRFRVRVTDAIVSFLPTYAFRPSVFDLSARQVKLGRKHPKATIHIVAQSGDSNLAWHITNQPDWVVLSQANGLGDKDVTIEAQAQTPVGSIANLNLDTDPKGGANNVETGPLILRVEVEKN